MSSPTDSSIPVTVNGDGRTVPEDYPLTELLRDLEIDPDNEDEAAGVAVALNESVVRRQDYTSSAGPLFLVSVFWARGWGSLIGRG